MLTDLFSNKKFSESKGISLSGLYNWIWERLELSGVSSKFCSATGPIVL